MSITRCFQGFKFYSKAVNLHKILKRKRSNQHLIVHTTRAIHMLKPQAMGPKSQEIPAQYSVLNENTATAIKHI